MEKEIGDFWNMGKHGQGTDYITICVTLVDQACEIISTRPLWYGSNLKETHGVNDG